MKNYRKPKKIKTVKRLGKVIPICLVLMFVGGVLAETFDYFYEESITVYGQEVLKIDGTYREAYNTASNITLGPGESVTKNYTVEYTGNLSQFNLSITNTNGMAGLSHQIYLDDIPMGGDYAVLNQNQVYDLGILFTADYNMSGASSDIYVLTIAPSPNQ